MNRQHVCFCVFCALLGAVLAALGLAPTSTGAAEPAVKPVSFIGDIAPVFKESCFGCHDAKKRKGKLDMTTYENFRKGGDNEDSIVPGNPDESPLIDLITTTRAKRMPPKDAGEMLPKDKVELIARWIKEGAKLDEGIDPKADLVRELRRRWTPPAPPASYKFAVQVNALAFSPDDARLVVGGYHELTVWEVASGKLLQRVHTRAERAIGMTFLSDGKLAVAGGRPGQEGDLVVYDLSAGKPRDEAGVAILDGVRDKAVRVASLLEADDSVLCVAASADGKRLACGGSDRTVHVWNLADGADKAKLDQRIENHADWVFGLAFDPEGKRLLTCGRDKTAKVWDLEKKEALLTFPDHQNVVYGVAVRPDGKAAFSVGEDNQLRLWKADGDGKQIKASSGHGKPVLRVLAHPKQPLVVTCGADGTVRAWNSENGAATRTLAKHDDWVYAIALSHDGEFVASGSSNGEVRISKVADGSLVKSFNASPGLVVEQK